MEFKQIVQTPHRFEVQPQAKRGASPLQATGFAMLDEHKLRSWEVLRKQAKKKTSYEDFEIR